MDECARILSIEDELTVRRSIVGFLEDSGYDMLEAENGRVGLEIFHAEHPDLVLCDLRMPEVNGLQVLEDVVRSAPETPIIVVSGTGTMSDAIDALRLGAWDYVTKPIRDMHTLEHAIDKALERARLIRENRESQELLAATNRRLSESLGQLEEDEMAARQIQFQLLPKQPATLEPFQFAWHITTSAFLSGDFVDYFQIDDRHLGFYIADVSGHGVSSAFVTVLLKTTMNRLLEQYQRSEDDTLIHPERVLKLLNGEIVAQEFDKYLTIFYAVVDSDSKTIVCSNGGHFPAPIMHDGESIRYLDSKSLAVGLFDFATYEAVEISCAAEFTMALFSDGVLEMRPGVDLKTQKRDLLAEVERLSRQPLSTPLVELMEQFVSSMGIDATETPIDDITVLLVRKETSQ